MSQTINFNSFFVFYIFLKLVVWRLVFERIATITWSNCRLWTWIKDLLRILTDWVSLQFLFVRLRGSIYGGRVWGFLLWICLLVKLRDWVILSESQIYVLAANLSFNFFLVRKNNFFISIHIDNFSSKDGGCGCCFY